MKTLRYAFIILAAFIIVILLWFFKPLPPSDLKGSLANHAYLTGMVNVRHLWDRPFAAIGSAIPPKAASLPSIPSFLRPILPPNVELYLFNSREGGGWAMTVDLGWRSKLLRMMHGLIMEQIQYRGFGAIEGENTIRTPSGHKFLIVQDAGTLFVAEGENFSREILKPASDRSAGLTPQVDAGENIAYISFSNREGEFAKVIEDEEKEIGFLILPSAGSLSDGIIKVRETAGDTLVAEISFGVREGGDMEGVEGDISYLTDLLDRFLSTRNFKTDKTINKENGKIIAQVMIHPLKNSKMTH